MNQTRHPEPNLDPQALELRQAHIEVRAPLLGLAKDLHAVLEDETLGRETPLEVWHPLGWAVETLDVPLRRLESAGHAKGAPSARDPDAPTYRQGQFLAYIHEYMRYNHSRVAPTHAEMQRFFKLTAPSVNSMLIRREERGFIHRLPGVAPGTELCIDPEGIPPLDNPFRP